MPSRSLQAFRCLLSSLAIARQGWMEGETLVTITEVEHAIRVIAEIIAEPGGETYLPKQVWFGCATSALFEA